MLEKDGCKVDRYDKDGRWMIWYQLICIWLGNDMVGIFITFPRYAFHFF